MRRWKDWRGTRFLCAAFSLFPATGAVICYFITAILYSNSMGSLATTVQEWVGMSVSVLGILFMTITVFWKDPYGMFSIFVPAAWVFSMVMLAASQVQNIAYAAAGITDMGMGILPSFVVGEILYLIAVVLGVVGTLYKFD